MGYALPLREAAEGSCDPGQERRACAAGGASVDALDSDMVQALGDEIATLAAHLHAGRQRLLELIARFDALAGWEPAGHRSCAHWLAFRTGLDLATAREHVRVARALGELPLTSASMARGELAFSQVRALTRVAETSTEADLLELARGCTTAQLERMVRAWRKGSRRDEANRERERHASRSLSVFPDDDGMYVVNGRLDPEVGALLMRAIEAAGDALYREQAAHRARISGAERNSEQGESETDTDRESARRRADAVGLLAERALAAGFGTQTESDLAYETFQLKRSADPERSAEPACSCGRRSDDPAPEVPISGSRAERYQVVLHVEHTTLVREGEPGRSELDDGTRVSAETSRRLSCDAALVRVTRGPRGSVLNVGRRTRTIPPALRRALEVRDRGCRFPGCGLRFADAHHVVHWADGGETSLDNSMLLCRYHHRLVHEGGWEVEWWGLREERAAAFRDRRGQLHVGRPRRAPEVPAGPGAVRALVRMNRLRGARPHAMTASARWKREADIPDEVLFRAAEAAV